MNKREYKWHIKMVQGRYPQLKLSFEQAEKVHQFEKDKEVFSDEFIFSFWEEMDCELDTFQRILTPEQFAIHHANWREMTTRHEQQLVEKDKEFLSQLRQCQEKLAYYQHIFLPDLYTNKLFFALSRDSTIQSKVIYLRAEYNKWWKERKKAILVGHYRYNRLFSPNQLKYELTSHELLRVCPSYDLFEDKMDEPTKVIADFIRKHPPLVLDEFERTLKKKLNEQMKFSEKLDKEYFDEGAKLGQGGWHTTIIPTPEQAKEEFLMSLLLMENDMSLFQPPE
jgi:hypothetical protein